MHLKPLSKCMNFAWYELNIDEIDNEDDNDGDSANNNDNSYFLSPG